MDHAIAMQREVLVSMLGFTGELIRVAADGVSFELAPDTPFVHPANRDAIERLASLGADYAVLADFIAQGKDNPRMLLWTRVFFFFFFFYFFFFFFFFFAALAAVGAFRRHLGWVGLGCR